MSSGGRFDIILELSDAILVFMVVPGFQLSDQAAVSVLIVCTVCMHMDFHCAMQQKSTYWAACGTA